MTNVLRHQNAVFTALQWSSWEEKRQNSFRRYCGFKIRQIYIQLTKACGAYCNRKCTKHASLISTTSKQRIRTKWATLSLLQLCASGIIVFQLVSGLAVVVTSTAFNSDVVLRPLISLKLSLIVESNSWYSGLIFLQLSVMTLCVLIHDDRLIYKVK